MPSHSEIRHSPYRPEQLFAMVMDIERYPEFLPWCKAARITEQNADFTLGELVISFKHLTESYSSKITTQESNGTYEIHVTQMRGPFKTLVNHWKFTPSPQGGSDIHFHIDFQFRAKLLDHLIGGLFTKAQEKMVQAFSTRADTLYA